MKILFLDIDGVLNDHDFSDVSKSCSIKKSCVEQLNRIIITTQPSVVLSTAWRYMILGKAITTKGFEYMLRTHGVTSEINIIDITPSDEEIRTRGEQISAWLSIHPEIKKYAILDDMEISGHDNNFVLVDGINGLTQIESDKVIEILNGN